MQVAGQRHFTFGACLGKGGFGEVYRATMSTSGGISREVAVKLLRSDLDLNDEAVRRLRDEGKLLARIDHPALLGVHDLVVLDDRVALVTEFVDGEDLSACFRARPQMPVRALLQAVGAAADALNAAWTAPIGPSGRALRLVHRDIKPSNLRVSRHGQLKVLDFGIARTDEVTREARTATDFIVGSPTYMAPERFLDTEVRSASDVFALGCVLYEGLTGGERLFGGASPMMMSTLALDRDRFETFVAERELPPDVHPDVARLVRECLRFDPTSRPSAAALGRRCEELADRVGGASLARWAKEREWPTGIASKGELEGKVVTLGTLDRGAPPAPPEAASGVSRFVAFVVLATSVAAAAVAFLAAAGGGAAAWWAGWFQPTETSALATEGDVPEDAGVGSAPAPVEPEGAPAVVPSRSGEAPPTIAPRPRGSDAASAAPPTTAPPEPGVAPTVSAPPTPAPAAPVAPVPTGTVRLEGDVVRVELVGGRTVALTLGAGTSVPVGLWTPVSYDPVQGRREHAPIVVSEGGAVSLSCSAAMSTCRVR